MSAKTVRAAIVKVCHETLSDELRFGNWTYAPIRPEDLPPKYVSGEHQTADCSSGGRRVVRWGGGPDPAGLEFGPWGNSETVWWHLVHHESAADAELGDPVCFGVYGRDHMAIVIETGEDPLLWSDGHQGAPNTYRASWDPRSRTYLRLMPDDPPTPQDRLRAMTGFYAWAAWRLGEGPWRAYGRLNPTVRPNVPKSIVVQRPTWFPRLRAMLARRHKPNPATTAGIVAPADG